MLTSMMMKMVSTSKFISSKEKKPVQTTPEVLEFQKKWKPRFFTIWTGQAFSLLGSSLVQFALIWWITQKTGSATILATVTLVAILPQILLGPLAGALVDRWSRRAVMIVADSLIAAASLGLVYLFATGTVQVWHIYAISLIRSAGGAFHWPAMSASTSEFSFPLSAPTLMTMSISSAPLSTARRVS